MNARVIGCALAVALATACGPSTPQKPKTPGPAPSASDAARPAPPAGLPKMAEMPPPGVRGSKKAKTRDDDKLWACAASAAAGGRGAASERAKAIGEACSGPSKMKPVGAPFTGSQAAGDAHTETKARVEAGKCYRLYFAFDGEDGVAVLRDSAGDVIAESNGPAVPERGAACFTSADEITILFAAGSGKGAFAAQLYGE